MTSFLENVVFCQLYNILVDLREYKALKLFWDCFLSFK